MEPDLSRFEAKRHTRVDSVACKAARVIAKMGEQDQVNFHAALADQDRFTSEAISAVFHEMGTPVSPALIRKHRQGTCNCARG